MTTTFNLAPDVFDEANFHNSIRPFTDGANGLGRFLATLPDEAGWDQSTFFDHDLGSHLFEAAMDSAKAFAKHNNLFYNNTKLEDAISQALVVAYSDGFLAAKAGVA